MTLQTVAPVPRFGAGPRCMAQTGAHLRFSLGSSFVDATAAQSNAAANDPAPGFALIIMQINGNMIVLAREIRGMTQQYLASRLAMSLYALSRVERGLLEEISDQHALTIAHALEFPVDFFRQGGEPPGPAASPCCTAGKTALDEADQKRVRGVLSLLRVNIGKLLGAVKIVPCRELPAFAPEPQGADPIGAAAALRSLWNIADGPIGNLAALIEGAGVIIVRCDFGMSASAATSLRIAGVPPLILIDRSIPGDQYRMMLAHQLAHLVMHREVTGGPAEAQADAFAHELLLPRSRMQSAFQATAPIALDDLDDMRMHWKVPVAALLERAHALGLIDAGARNRLWTNARIRTYPAEPRPVPQEEATTLRDMLDCYASERGLGVEDLARLFKIGMRDIAAWYGTSMPRAGTPVTPESRGCVLVRPAARKRRPATFERL